MRFDYLIYLYSLRNFRNGFIWWINNLLQKGLDINITITIMKQV